MNVDPVKTAPSIITPHPVQQVAIEYSTHIGLVNTNTILLEYIRPKVQVCRITKAGTMSYRRRYNIHKQS